METGRVGRKRTQGKQITGQELIANLNQAVRWAKGERIRFGLQPFGFRDVQSFPNLDCGFSSRSSLLIQTSRTRRVPRQIDQNKQERGLG